MRLRLRLRLLLLLLRLRPAPCGLRLRPAPCACLRRRSGRMVQVCDAEIVFFSLSVGRQNVIGFFEREELCMQSWIGEIVVRVIELMIDSKVRRLMNNFACKWVRKN